MSTPGPRMSDLYQFVFFSGLFEELGAHAAEAAVPAHRRGQWSVRCYCPSPRQSLIFQMTSVRNWNRQRSSLVIAPPATDWGQSRRERGLAALQNQRNYMTGSMMGSLSVPRRVVEVSDCVQSVCLHNLCWSGLDLAPTRNITHKYYRTR